MSSAVGIESRLDRWVRAGGEGGHAPGAPQRGGRRPFFFEVGARQPRTRTYPERGTYRGSEVRNSLLRVGCPVGHGCGG